MEELNRKEKFDEKIIEVNTFKVPSVFSEFNQNIISISLNKALKIMEYFLTMEQF